MKKKKKEKIEYYNNQNINQSFKINQLSQEILFENKPDYLNMKVEERLFEQGKKIELKKKEKEEQYLKEVCKGNNKIKNNYSYIESKYLNIKPYINKKVKKRINIALNKDQLSNINFNNRINSNRHIRGNNAIIQKINNIYYSLNNNDTNCFTHYSSQKELINENLNNDNLLESNKKNKEIKDIRKRLNQFYYMENKNKNSSSNNNINQNDENYLNNNNVYNDIIYNTNEISKNINLFNNYHSTPNLNLSSGQNNLYSCPENYNQNNFNENNNYPIDNSFKDNYNIINVNTNSQYYYQINENNIINEIFQRENEHLNYLDERLKKNQENKNKILQNL